MRRLGIFIGVVSVVSTVILVASLSRFDVNHYRTQIQTEMEHRLGRKVALGNLKLRPLPPRLRAENLTIFEGPDFGGQTLFLKADTVDLSMRLLPLLRHKIEIDAMELQRPRAEVVKNAKGLWNFSSIGQGRQQSSSGSGTGVAMEGNVILHEQYTSKSPKIEFAFWTLNANLPEVLAIARAYRTKGLAGISGSGTLNLDIHASGPVRPVRSSEIMRLLGGSANMNLSNVRIAGLDVEHEITQNPAQGAEKLLGKTLGKK